MYKLSHLPMLECTINANGQLFVRLSVQLWATPKRFMTLKYFLNFRIQGCF